MSAVEQYTGRNWYKQYNYRDRLHVGEKILDRRNAGETMTAICESLNISLSTGQRWMQLSLATRTPLSVDEFRRQQNDRLDRTQRTIEEQIEIANALGRDGKIIQAANLRSQAIALQLRLDERRAKLNGIDAPIRVDANVTVMDSQDAELAEIIAETRARASADRDA
jgi:hypothetical protein